MVEVRPCYFWGTVLEYTRTKDNYVLGEITGFLPTGPEQDFKSGGDGFVIFPDDKRLGVIWNLRDPGDVSYDRLALYHEDHQGASQSKFEYQAREEAFMNPLSDSDEDQLEADPSEYLDLLGSSSDEEEDFALEEEVLPQGALFQVTQAQRVGVLEVFLKKPLKTRQDVREAFASLLPVFRKLQEVCVQKGVISLTHEMIKDHLVPITE